MGALPVQDDRLVWLDDACHGRELVGGKGASLSRLFIFGAPVPPAISFTTHAYRDLACHLDLGAHLTRLADDAHAALRHVIAESPLPGSVDQTVRRGWTILRERIGPEPRLAVRSSAIDEDGGGYSFAGLHDTILGVCEAIGQDFGFNPTWLRLAFIAPIFFAPYAAVGAYLGLGVIVAATRLLFKDKPASEQVVEAKAVEVVEDDTLPMAA